MNISKSKLERIETHLKEYEAFLEKEAAVYKWKRDHKYAAEYSGKLKVLRLFIGEVFPQ